LKRPPPPPPPPEPEGEQQHYRLKPVNPAPQVSRDTEGNAIKYKCLIHLYQFTILYTHPLYKIASFLCKHMNSWWINKIIAIYITSIEYQVYRTNFTQQVIIKIEKKDRIDSLEYVATWHEYRISDKSGEFLQPIIGVSLEFNEL
jgi:hypothetical protein